MEDVLDKEMFVGFFGTLLFLAFLLNLFLLVLILWPLNRHSSLWPFHNLLVICPFQQHPVVQRKSPKHVVLVATCVTQILTAILHHSLVLGLYNNRSGYLPPPVSCSTAVLVELAAILFPTLTRLLVIVVVVTEIQRLLALDDFKRMATACVLMVVSAMYVCSVLLPVFFFQYLAFATQPCYPDTYGTLRYTSNASEGRVLPVMSYIVPVIVLLFSIGLLVVIYSQKNHKPTEKSLETGASGKHHHNGSVGFPPQYQGGNPGVWNGNPNSVCSTDEYSMPLEYSGEQSAGYGPDHTLDFKRITFPYDTLCAAVLVIVLEFLFCVRQFVYWDQVDYRLMSTKEWIRLWAADRFLSLLALTALPCCWLFDPYIQDFFRSLRNSAHQVGKTGGITHSETSEQAKTAAKTIRFSPDTGGLYQNEFNEKSVWQSANLSPRVYSNDHSKFAVPQPWPEHHQPPIDYQNLPSNQYENLTHNLYNSLDVDRFRQTYQSDPQRMLPEPNGGRVNYNRNGDIVGQRGNLPAMDRNRGQEMPSATGIRSPTERRRPEALSPSMRQDRRDMYNQQIGRQGDYTSTNGSVGKSWGNPYPFSAGQAVNAVDNVAFAHQVRGEADHPRREQEYHHPSGEHRYGGNSDYMYGEHSRTDGQVFFVPRRGPEYNSSPHWQTIDGHNNGSFGQVAQGRTDRMGSNTAYSPEQRNVRSASEQTTMIRQNTSAERPHEGASGGFSAYTGHRQRADPPIVFGYNSQRRRQAGYDPESEC